MNNESNESKSIIVYSQGDPQEDGSPQKQGQKEKQTTILIHDEASIFFSKSHLADSAKKFPVPDTIEERDQKSEQDGSLQDSFLEKPDRDEIQQEAKKISKSKSLQKFTNKNGAKEEKEGSEGQGKETADEKQENQKEDENGKKLISEEGSSKKEQKQKRKESSEDSFGEIQEENQNQKESPSNCQLKPTEKVNEEKIIEESQWLQSQKSIICKESPQKEIHQNKNNFDSPHYPETDADWQKPQHEFGRGRGSGRGRGQGSDFRSSERDDYESPNRGRGGFHQYGRGRGQGNFGGRGRGQGNFGGRGRGQGNFGGRGRGQGNFGGRGRGQGNFGGRDGGRGRGQSHMNYGRNSYERNERSEGRFEGRGRGSGRGFSGRQDFEERKDLYERKYEFDFKNKANILPEIKKDVNERNLCEVPGDVSIISKLQDIEPAFSSSFEPEGQKCWPEISLYVLRVKVSLTFRHLMRHKADLLIIPCNDKQFKLYPGNILNRSPFNYREKLEEKNFFSREGEVYLQKCVGIENFKAFGFMNVGENGVHIKECMEKLILELTKIDIKIKVVLFPFSEAFESVLPILEKAFEGLNKMKFKTKLNEFIISTNHPEAFNYGCLQFVSFVNELVKNNEICIDF